MNEFFFGVNNVLSVQKKRWLNAAVWKMPKAFLDGLHSLLMQTPENCKNEGRLILGRLAHNLVVN